MFDQRSIRLTSTLGDGLRFRSLRGEEALSRPFRFELEFACDDSSIDLAGLLGTAMTVELDVVGGKRWFHGLVSRCAFAGHEGNEARYRATLRPWLWFLSRTADCRIFQEQTAPDIVHAIFAKHAGPSVHVEDRLSGAFAPRVYCVQYRESDLDFVDRLLQDEGITYFFAHEADKHTLVLANAPGAHRSFPSYETVPYFAKSPFARRERDHVHAWDVQAEVRSGSFVHTSFDFEKPRADLVARREQPLPQGGWAEGELYDYSGRYTEPDQGDRGAALRLEADQAEHMVAFGEGTAAGLAAGYRFKLEAYPREDQNAEYLLREVEHELWDPAYRSGEEAGQEVEVYRCRFTAMPAEVPYRPPLATPRPLIRGPQTAMVTGPAGEEIWTDKYGRVKVQFPWDREGKRDEKTSCWVRVSQPWAGTGYGGMVIPRIGQEVIVEFLEGDPDRPIITGRVYNAQAMPPYPLPAGQNQSGLKSNSTKGGGGSNELMFDDSKGKEKTYFHAQFDHDAVVENNMTEHVKVNKTGTVDANETLRVHGARERTVDGKETVKVGASRERTVTGTEKYEVTGARSYKVGGTEQLDVTGDQTVGLAAKRKLTIAAGDEVTVNAGGAKLTVSGGSREVSAAVAYKLEATTVEITGMASITLKVGGSSIKIDPSGVSIMGPIVKLN